MDDLEAAWQREQQVADAREAREQALADCDDMLAMLRGRAAGPASAWQPPEPAPVQRQRQPSTPRPVPPPAPPVGKVSLPVHDSAGRISSLQTFESDAAKSAASWSGYIEERIARKIEAFAGAFGGGIGEVLREDIIGPYNAKIAALEARIAELERVTGQGMREAADD